MAIDEQSNDRRGDDPELFTTLHLLHHVDFFDLKVSHQLLGAVHHLPGPGAWGAKRLAIQFQLHS